MGNGVGSRYLSHGLGMEVSFPRTFKDADTKEERVGAEQGDVNGTHSVVECLV